MSRSVRLRALITAVIVALLLNFSWVVVALADADGDGDGFGAAQLIAVPPALVTTAAVIGVVYWRSRRARSREG